MMIKNINIFTGIFFPSGNHTLHMTLIFKEINKTTVLPLYFHLVINPHSEVRGHGAADSSLQWDSAPAPSSPGRPAPRTLQPQTAPPRGAGADNVKYTQSRCVILNK